VARNVALPRKMFKPSKTAKPRFDVKHIGFEAILQVVPKARPMG